MQCGVWLKSLRGSVSTLAFILNVSHKQSSKADEQLVLDRGEVAELPPFFKMIFIRHIENNGKRINTTKKNVGVSSEDIVYYYQ